MILMYRIIRGLLELTYPYLATLRSRDTFSTTRGHQYKIFKYPVHYNAQANFLHAEMPICGITYHQKLLKLHHWTVLNHFQITLFCINLILFLYLIGLQAWLPSPIISNTNTKFFKVITFIKMDGVIIDKDLSN